MEDRDKKLKIATFRFGMIADFVNGTRLDYGEKERLLQAKSEKLHEIPFSKQQRIARSTLEKWVQDYKRGGYVIEALYPKTRKDRGQIRSVPTHIKLAIKELKKENPKLTLPTIITALRHKKLIGADEKVNLSSLYRYWNHEELHSLNEGAVDKRHFEARYPNEIWQSDVMYGPMVRLENGGRSRQSYLIAILDDHSRMIMHSGFYLSERRESFLDCLRMAILSRGLPQKLYVDYVPGNIINVMLPQSLCAEFGRSRGSQSLFRPNGTHNKVMMDAQHSGKVPPSPN